MARIDEVILGRAGQRATAIPPSTRSTAFEGAGIVLSPRGQEIASYPLYAAVGANTYLNMPYQLEITRRRVETLAQSFAQWLPGQMGL